MPEVMTKPICKTMTCKKELTYLEDSKCWRCLSCNPLSKPAPTVEPERKYIDVAMTEERVREIVRDELENWHIQKPPVTKTEAKEIDTSLRNQPVKVTTMEDLQSMTDEPTEPNWRQQAKELGINTFQMKKVDALAAIESEKLRRQ